MDTSFDTNKEIAKFTFTPIENAFMVVFLTKLRDIYDFEREENSGTFTPAQIKHLMVGKNAVRY